MSEEQGISGGGTAELGANFDRVLASIERASGDRKRGADREVSLVAVSKGQTVDAIVELFKHGQRDFGENYVQELVTKAQELADRGIFGIRWHFIGHLQSNKAKTLAQWVHSVHTLDSEATARELAKRWAALEKSEKLQVFIEVNIDREASKSGVPPEEAPALARAIAAIPVLDLRGLMCVPAAGDTRAAFVRLRELEEKCRPATHGELSMGMSADFEAAILEGASHVRVGTLLFGARQ